MNNSNLYQDGRECYGRTNILIENFFILAQIVLGALLLRHFTFLNIPVLSVVFLGFAFIMLGFVLRKHLCTHCYYYGKRCHCGWGFLAKAMYKKGVGNYQLGGKLASITWPSFMIVPLAFFVLSVLLNKTGFIKEIPLLLLFIFITAINMFYHLKDCNACKVRFICPGSAANKKL